MLLVARAIGLIHKLTKDIEIKVFGWQESEDILWDFLKAHNHHRVIVIDEYGYPVDQPHMPHERLPIKETDPV